MSQFNIDIPDDLKAQCKAASEQVDMSLTKWIIRAMRCALVAHGGQVQPVNVQWPSQPYAPTTPPAWTPPPPPPPMVEATLPPFDIAKPMSKNTIQKYLDEKLIGLYSAELHTAHYMRGDEVVSPLQFEGMTQEEFDKETCPEKRAQILQDLNIKFAAFVSARAWTEKLIINGNAMTVPDKRVQELKEAVLMARSLNNKIMTLNAERKTKGIPLSVIPSPSLEEIQGIVSTMKFGRTVEEEIYVETEEDKRERAEYEEMMAVQKETDNN